MAGDMIVGAYSIPDFIIQRKLGYSKGIMGANFWYMQDYDSVLNAGRKALKSLKSRRSYNAI